MRIAISSLGQSWLILPEVLGFVDPKRFDFYRNHPEASRIRALRQEHRIEGIDELWVFLTTDTKSKDSFSSMKRWAGRLDSSPLIKGWCCRGISDLRTEEECRYIRNALFSLVLHAHRKLQAPSSPPDQQGALYISLTGGRKTISGDLQDAANYFGSTLLFHIIDRDLNKHTNLLNLSWDNLNEPLGSKEANVFLPIPVGSPPFLDSSILKRDFLFHPEFQIPESEETSLQPLELEPSTKLIDTIEQRTKQAFYFYENLLGRGQEALQDRRNFLSLFTLPPRRILRMRETKIYGSESEHSPVYRFLHSLPKAELHCHLGGVLDPSEALEVATLWQKEVESWKRTYPKFQDWNRTLQEMITPRDIPRLQEEFRRLHSLPSSHDLQSQLNLTLVPRHIRNAAFLLSFLNAPELLDTVLFGELVNPQRFKAIDFEPYERLGDYQGSSLLQSEETIRRAVQIAIRKAAAHNVRYLELRCSPLNYTKGNVNTGLEVYRIIAQELSQAESEASRSLGKPVRYRALLIASRHRKLSQVYQYMELMEDIFQTATYPEMLAGVDLAGNEKQMPPERLREAFEPVMDRCQHITIHAGENEEVKNIWQAVYYLHAERIGHGLTLKNDPDLMQKFIDRGIALEMCPSSNIQIIVPELTEYPLKYYLEKGVPVTLNTDNPGISRTNLTREYLTAASLTPGGLSILQILQIVKNGFSAAFLPLPEREELLLSVEEELYRNSIPLLEEG